MLDDLLGVLFPEHVTIGCVHRLRRVCREWRRCVDEDGVLGAVVAAHLGARRLSDPRRLRRVMTHSERRCCECGRLTRRAYPQLLPRAGGHDAAFGSPHNCCLACRAVGYRATRRCRPSEPFGFQARSLDTQLCRMLYMLVDGWEAPAWLHDAARKTLEAHVTPHRIDLRVPYRDHQQAKHHGAHWDRVARVWYAPCGFSLLFLARWLDADDPARVRARDDLLRLLTVSS